MEAMRISMSGLDVEWQRLEIISQNLANANTTRTGSGDRYQPLRLVSGPDFTFTDLVGGASALSSPTGVRVYNVEQTAAPTRAVLDPEHPHADEDGMVHYPGLNHAQEMTMLLQTSRVYEANLSAISTARQMYSAAMNMGQ